MTPFFFILSPGADPVKEVETLGKRMIALQANVNYHNVAMGQGQDVVAIQKLDMGHKEGHWVMLQNVPRPRLSSGPRAPVDQPADPSAEARLRSLAAASSQVHLMPRWCAELEKRLDAFAAEIRAYRPPSFGTPPTTSLRCF